jgi:aryl-alcohol dehydrogenase-like predicted oxidoreductase
VGLSAFYGEPESDEARFRVLDRALELGETFWDSADIYQDSEDLLGKWFNRHRIFLATKFGNKALPSEKGRVVDSSPEYAKEACEKSLKRLGVDCIDLYYCHRVDKKTPIEKTVKAMVELKK